MPQSPSKCLSCCSVFTHRDTLWTPTPVLRSRRACNMLIHMFSRVERVQKRASNVLKLAQENEKLMEELRAMNARLEEAERRQQELRQREAQRGTQATAATS